MTDIEKILIGLEGCNIDGTCDGCPYYAQCNGMIYKPRERLIHDAIALIKKQKKRIEELEEKLDKYETEKEQREMFEYFEG